MMTIKDRQPWTVQKILPYLLLVCSVIGLLASFTLTYDKIQVLHNPGYKPSCNLNPILSCGSVMKMPQASVLGIPNSVFGIAMFSMLCMLSLTLLAGGVFRRWLWALTEVAAFAGVAFMHYLFFESTFRLHTICPWCFGVWMVTIPIFWAITIRNLREGVFGYPHKKLGKTVAGCIEDHPVDLLVFWYVVILVTILAKFWYYWKTLV